MYVPVCGEARHRSPQSNLRPSLYVPTERYVSMWVCMHVYIYIFCHQTEMCAIHALRGIPQRVYVCVQTSDSVDAAVGHTSYLHRDVSVSGCGYVCMHINI